MIGSLVLFSATVAVEDAAIGAFSVTVMVTRAASDVPPPLVAV